MTDNIDFDDENVDGLEYIEEEVDVSAFVVEEIQESKQQLATLIREYKDSDNKDEIISEEQNSNPIQVIKPSNITTIATANPVTFDDDFNFVRQNMLKMAKDGMIIMDDLIDIARSSQHPQMFRELTNTLKEMAVINKEILELHKTKAEIETAKNNVLSPTVQNNTQTNNYYGTTEELIAQIAKQNAIKQTGEQ